MELRAQLRENLGKAVTNLRRQGLVPAVAYGKGFTNLNLSVNLKELKRIYKEAGHSGVVDLTIIGNEEPIKVLITDTQRDPIGGEIIHVDFHKVNLAEKVSALVPIEFTGEPPVVKIGEGIILILLNEITVKALPLDLPHKISVDVSRLEKIGDALAVKDLPIDPTKIEVLSHHGEDLVVKIDYAVQIEKEEEVKAVEEVEVIKEKKEGEEETADEAETAEKAKGAEAKEEKAEKKEKR